MSGYIFDLDGTLLDSMHIWDDIGPGFLRARGIALPDDYATTVFDMSFAQSAEYTVRRFALPDSPEALMQIWNDMAASAYAAVQMKPHAKEYLLALRETGALLAIATALPARLYRPALDAHGISGLFDAIVGADEVALHKSQPDVFLRCAELLGLHPRECVVFEDLLAAIVCAKNAGMRVVGVYDDASQRDWPDIQQTADVAILSFEGAPLPPL